MRRETIIIRCDGDGCQKIAEVEDKSRMPEGWVQIRTPDSEGRIGTGASGLFDLCSLRCTSKWALARAQILGEITPRGPEANAGFKAPCPLCDMLVGIKGLHTHVKAVHPGEDYIAARQLWDESAAALQRIADNNGAADEHAEVVI